MVQSITRGLYNYFSGYCEEQSDVAIYYGYKELEIASRSS